MTKIEMHQKLQPLYKMMMGDQYLDVLNRLLGTVNGYLVNNK